MAIFINARALRSNKFPPEARRQMLTNMRGSAERGWALDRESRHILRQQEPRTQAADVARVNTARGHWP